MSQPDQHEHWLTPLGLVLCALSGMLSAVIEIGLIPLYAGATILPVTLAVAAIVNAALPILLIRLGASRALSFVPLVLWVLVVIGLSTARPEGDVLVPGGGTEGEVGIGLLVVGVLSGVLSGLLASRRSRPRPRPGSGSGSRGGASTPGR